MKKPLMVIGVRQIGKTYTIKKFAEENFEEFLLATNNQILLDKIKESYMNMTPMPEFAHEQALKLYKQYLCVGGMPESINNFIENNMDILNYDSTILSNIVEMYIADMKKYVKNYIETVKTEGVYKNIPAQLAKDKKAFQYNLVEEGGRKRKYEIPIEWLISSGMVLINSKVKKQKCH